MWEGRRVRMAAGVAARLTALPVAWEPLAARERRWRLPKDRAEEVGVGGERGHLWRAFVRHPQWEAPPLFRIQRPQSRPAPTPRSKLRGSVEGTG